MMRDYDITTTTPMVTMKAMLMTESYANDRKSSKIMYIFSPTAKIFCKKKSYFCMKSKHFALLFEKYAATWVAAKVEI